MLPQVRVQPWYPGQMGVAGSDVQRGLRWEPTGITLFVDPDSNNDTDAGDGTDPEKPLTTIGGAITRLLAHQTAMGVSLAGSTIVCAGAAYTESVTIPATIPYCRLQGASPNRFRPTWASGAAANPCLTVDAEGWVIDGFEFDCPASSAGVLLHEVPASSLSAYKTIVQNCTFDGLWSGLYGIQFVGAPHRVGIYNNWFIEMNQGDDSAFCIYVTDSTHTNPYQCEIVGNRFMDSDNYIGNLGRDRKSVV